MSWEKATVDKCDVTSGQVNNRHCGQGRFTSQVTTYATVNYLSAVLLPPCGDHLK